MYALGSGAIDERGNLYATGEAVTIWRPDGSALGRIEVPAAKEGAQPERPVLCDLAATADGHLYGIYGFKKYGDAPLGCVDIRTGELKWEHDGSVNLIPFTSIKSKSSSSPALA